MSLCSPSSSDVTRTHERLAARSAFRKTSGSSPAGSSLSTNARMRPPRERPARQAVSPATPKSSNRGAPSSITSSAAVTTSPSARPPETEPKNTPVSLIARCEPTGLAAEPQVSTTVAMATPRPDLLQCVASAKMSASSDDADRDSKERFAPIAARREKRMEFQIARRDGAARRSEDENPRPRHEARSFAIGEGGLMTPCQSSPFREHQGEMSPPTRRAVALMIFSAFASPAEDSFANISLRPAAP